MAGRSKTLKPGRLSKVERLDLQEMEGELEQERPQVRGECEGGHRPCPWVGCRFNLFLDVNPDNGHIKFNFPGLEPEEMDPDRSCALDLADRGGMTLEEVGETLSITRERIRQLEDEAKRRVKLRLKHIQEEEEMNERICACCKKVYIPTAYAQKYCSDACRENSRGVVRRVEEAVKEVVSEAAPVAKRVEGVALEAYQKLQEKAAKAEGANRELEQKVERQGLHINALAKENEGLKKEVAKENTLLNRLADLFMLSGHMRTVENVMECAQKADSHLRAYGVSTSSLQRTVSDLREERDKEDAFLHQLLVLVGEPSTGTREGDREAIINSVRALRDEHRELEKRAEAPQKAMKETADASQLIHKVCGIPAFNPCDLTLSQFQQAVLMFQGIAYQAGRIAVLDEEGE